MHHYLHAVTVLAFSLPLLGAAWPTNVVTVSDNAVIAECVNADNPYDCCTGPTAGACNGNGLDGADIWRGLMVCAYGNNRVAGGTGGDTDTKGCILDLGVGTYTNPEVTISFGGESARFGRSGVALSDDAFENGLWVRGRGRGQTILKQSIPPKWITGSNHSGSAIFFVNNWDPSGADKYGISRIRFSDFECDGQKSLQPSVEQDMATYSRDRATTVNAILGNGGCVMLNGTPSWGNSGQVLPLAVVENLYVHDFIGTGIIVGNAATSRVMDNEIRDIGCMQDVNAALCDAGPGPNLECVGSGNPESCCTGAGTGNCTPLLCCTGAGTGCQTYIPSDYNSGWFYGGAVTGETPCGCGAGDPGDCRGWNVEPNIAPQFGEVGEKTPSIYGMIISGHGTHLVARNSITRVNKYGSTSTCGATPSDWRSSDLVRFHQNTYVKAHMMNGTSFCNTWLSENNISSIGMQGEHGNEMIGIGSNGPGGRVWLIDNVLSTPGTAGIRMNHYTMIPGLKRALRIEGNIISNLTGAYVYTGSGMAIEVRSGLTESGPGTGCLDQVAFPNAQRELELVSNQVLATNSGFRTISVEDPAMGSDSDCPGSNNTLRMVGGSYLNGSQDTTNLAKIFAKSISATGVVLNGAGALTWLSGSTGSCSGWTKNGTTSVVDSSGNSIGTCP